MTYDYDRAANLGPQRIGLRPAPHMRTPLVGYLLRVEPSRVKFGHTIAAERAHEAPRVTLAYTGGQQEQIAKLATGVDQQIAAADKTRTMDSESTFVSADEYKSAQWITAAVGKEKPNDRWRRSGNAGAIRQGGGGCCTGDRTTPMSRRSKASPPAAVATQSM